MALRYNTGSIAYVQLLDKLWANGVKTSPRGQETRELLDVSLTIDRAEHAHTLATTRKLSLPIAATETMHLLAGLSSLEQLDLASGGRFSQYADRGRLRGAYGPRTFHQLLPVVSLLERDPDTRQAVVTIWNGHEHDEGSRDVPCTQSLHFLIRDGKLNLRVSMRSSDAIMGIPYDWLMFSRLQLVLADCLGLPAGTFTFTTASLHVYERDLETMEDVVMAGVLRQPRLTPLPPLSVTRSRFDDGHEDKATLRLQRTRWDALVLCLSSTPDVVKAHGTTGWEPYLKHIPRLPEEFTYCERCRYVVPLNDIRGLGFCSECSP